ncbi:MULTISPECIES: anthranilate phosphoribosyltransferase [Anaerosinus]|uniref:Anthranilate phosphoribosyltransferase n=1 Tax=Selenobaculum gibii TaxID=3054208 RepID=A0A9Y2AHF1_9FIRM|nr:anthranilate phosphoribosyltransferase [Selenobaculum gbiensis]WIW69748.1 anthranilate phosphoribosyltransferase [Selenobaculum gbiensis]
MLKKYLSKVIKGEHLSQEESRQAMQIIMNGNATDAQIGSFLTALKVKGEISEEISGFAHTLLQHADRVKHSKPVICPCGTGGDTKGTFNVSTTVAFVLAGGGVAVAKHGNRSVSSACGSADVLSQLGVIVDKSADKVSEEIEHLDIGFLFAPALNKAMRVVANPRKELGFRTVFNLLGPIINPAQLDYQLVGVYEESLTEKVAEVLNLIGVKQAMVVHSEDGMDEISTNFPTKVSEMRNGKVKTYHIDPQRYGFKRGTLADYQGGNPEENAKIIRAILNGEKGPKRDIVLLNAAAGFYITNKTPSITEGIRLAEKTIDSGAALVKLEALIAFSREGIENAC